MGKEQVEKRIHTFLERRLKEEGTINSMMNMELVRYDDAKRMVILSFPVKKWQLNPAGNMHGGMISTALDITMGCASYVFSDADFTPTIQMAVNYNQSVKEHDILMVEGICDHAGSRMIQSRAIAVVTNKKTVAASANGSYAVNKNSKQEKPV